MDKIWDKVTEDTSSGGWTTVAVLFTDTKKTFDTPGDEFYCDGDKCRKRTLHNVGSVAKMKWVDLGGHSYTGLFKGGEAGLVRFSTGPTGSNSMTAGIGVKFLRDGVDSGNFVAMESLNAQSSFDFFQEDF